MSLDILRWFAIVYCWCLENDIFSQEKKEAGLCVCLYNLVEVYG